MQASIIPLSDAYHYVRKPVFYAERQALNAASIRHVVQLLFLTLLVIVVLSGLIGGIISSVMGELPANENDLLGQSSPMAFLLTGVILAPIIEELMFRSWLGGPRACLIGLPILASVATLLAAGVAGLPQGVTMGMAAFFAVMIFFISRQYAVRAPKEQAWARLRLFPLAFYGSALLFGLMHLANYEGGLSSWVMLLAVLPQGLVGLVLAYLRMRFGLLMAIAFHAAYNGVLISLFLTGQSIAPVTEAGAEAGTTAIMSALLWLPLVVSGMAA